jgi:hypothetical protein
VSYTLLTGKTDAKKIKLIAVPKVCCVLRCTRPAVMSRCLTAIRAWASLCEKHYGVDGLKLDLNKMQSSKKARLDGTFAELWNQGKTLPRRRDGQG